MSGLFAVNKPSGVSSAGLLNELQSILKRSPLFESEIAAQQERSNAGRTGRKARHGNKLKMGHGGTLDPLASGVLVVGTGLGTKLLGKFLSCSKDYEATAMFGYGTDTFDSEGKIVSTRPWQHITRDKLETVLDQFRGDIMQTPPIYSALKMQGKPLYEYAREGKPLPAEIKARPAQVSKFEVVEFGISKAWNVPQQNASEEIILSAQALENLPRITTDIIGNKPEPKDSNAPRSEEDRPSKRIKVETADDTKDGYLCVKLDMTVSSGTYVRSLIHDLGLALGSAAHMVALVRKRVGEFTLQKAVPWPAFQTDAWQTQLRAQLDFADIFYDNEQPHLAEQGTDLEVKARSFVDSLTPFGVTLTYAQSIDARIAGPGRQMLTISSAESFRVTHLLRQRHDIILIGSGTFLSDNPGLNARDENGLAYPLSQQPIPVILDLCGRVNVDPQSKLMQNFEADRGQQPYQIVKESLKTVKTSAIVLSIPDELVDKLEHAEWRLIVGCLSHLGKSIMIEGGASIINSVLEQNAASQVIVTIAPIFIGPGTSLELRHTSRLDTRSIERFGPDVVVAGTVKSGV